MWARFPLVSGLQPLAVIGVSIVMLTSLYHGDLSSGSQAGILLRAFRVPLE